MKSQLAIYLNRNLDRLCCAYKFAKAASLVVWSKLSWVEVAQQYAGSGLAQIINMNYVIDTENLL